MFEIKPDDIAQLDDSQLRTLVGLLCEAELRKRRYSTAAVTYGGDQTARDGGLDVRVSLPEDREIDGFIPRRATGFQVKRQDMPTGAIMREMCPEGLLRPVIIELARNDGAYIIVSSRGATSDSALKSRRKAMQEAAGGDGDKLALDFYDRTRLASWVRCHAGLVVWVRAAIGRAIEGWEPFGAWAFREGGPEAEYLIEKGVRIVALSKKTRDDLSAEQGLERIRQPLQNAKGVVRLVGLSGVGKTRFAQALFDARIGQHALLPALAVYTNMSNDPNPQPFHLASDLIANGLRAILIVDNCGADLHASLSQLVRTTGSLLSVLTIEYDIRDDQPEGTEVFEVEAASTELIRLLLQKRFPKLSQVDARTAAEFSGGNARIAIALAEAAERGGPLGSLSDAQLFKRLFDQRRGADKSLLRMAEACALLYSFDGEDVSDEGELAGIARMAGATSVEAYSHVAQLLDRNLAQQRGKWRALLPHALANSLAAAALKNIPYTVIKSSLVDGASKRLAKSFARRLGYLDKSSEAKEIVHGWFGRNGWIGPYVWNLSEFGKEVFRNCLSADPEGGLRALEAGLPSYGLDEPIVTGDYIARALRSLAWDATLFERSVRLLEKIAVYGEGKTREDAANRHRSLFYLYLSGTHATTAQRAAAVRKLVDSAVPGERVLGLAALGAMLEVDRLSSDYDFQFGGRSRDYGYQPRTWEELDHWYRTGLELAVDVALSQSPAAGGARKALAEKFRGLWRGEPLRDEIENAVAKLAAKDFWREGWHAVKRTRSFDAKDKTSKEYARLSELEVTLRPRHLRNRVQGTVFMSSLGDSDFDDFDLNNPDSIRVDTERKNEEAVRLGTEVGKDEAVLKELLPEIVAGRGNLFHFGRGLARGSGSPEKTWDLMVEELARASPSPPHVAAFCGMLWELSAATSDLPDQWLDNAIDQPPLAAYFPDLQRSLVVDARGINRLIRSLKTGKAPIESYRYINLSLDHPAAVPASDAANFVRALAKVPGGGSVAIYVLRMAFAVNRQNKRAHVSELIAAGRELLCGIEFNRNRLEEDYDLASVIEGCLTDIEGHAPTKTICGNLLTAARMRNAYGSEHVQLLKSLLGVQSDAAMDALFGGDEEECANGKNLMWEASQAGGNPMEVLSDAELLAWCEKDPSRRFPIAASVATIFAVSGDQQPAGWSQLAVRLVHSAPNPLAVMAEMADRLRPRVWSGLRSTILDRGASLLDVFPTNGNNALAAFIADQKQELQGEAGATLEWETDLHKRHDERFE